jgi:hypothetical protein
MPRFPAPSIPRLFIVATLVAAAPALHAADTSDKTWMPAILSPEGQAQHYLPDFSYAGYHWGEQNPPENGEPGATSLNVADFGAVGDDDQDDTPAFKKAFAKAHETSGPVVVRIPKGKFILKDILYIERSHFVLQGAGDGPNGTILYCPVPLSKLPLPAYNVENDEYLRVNDTRQKEPERGIDIPFSRYAWAGGFIWTNVPGGRGKAYLSKYNRPATVLARVSAGKRGEHWLEVDDAAHLPVGKFIRLNWYNREGEHSSLLKYLYENAAVKIGSRHWENPGEPVVRQEVTVERVEGHRVWLKEPLMHDVRAEWFNDLTTWDHLVEVGIEKLRFQFLFEEFWVHHGDLGFNAIYLTNVAHSWVRHVTFQDADSGLLTDVCANVTMENIRAQGRKAHYSVYMGDCIAMLARKIIVANPCVHALTFNTGSRLCVYTDCLVTREPTLDQHSGANHQCLFDNIDLYEDTPERTILTAGGAPYWKPSHGPFNTFWDIRIHYLTPHPSEEIIPLKGVPDGVGARLVGITANYPVKLVYGPDPYVEGLNRPGIAVPSLYEYQLKRRLAK